MAIVTLDPLPLKRMRALDESGLEIYPPDVSQEEKPLLQLVQQPVEREAKKAKKDTQAWPSQSVVEHFHQAQEELMTLIDFLNHVEANEVLSVTNMMKPKPLPHEACAEYALRISSKTQKYKQVSKYLKGNAKAFRRRVDGETVFYEALMRLQRNWKIKRLRKAFSGPGVKADFAIDLSVPLPMDSNITAFARSHCLNVITVEPDANGLLVAQLPSGKSIKSMVLSLSDWKHGAELRKPLREVKVGEEKSLDAANKMLRDVHLSNFYELLFDFLSREVLQDSSFASLSHISGSVLGFGLGDTVRAHLKLSAVDEQDETTEFPGSDARKITVRATEASAWIYLQQGFHSKLLKRSCAGSRTDQDDPSRLLRNFSEIIRHRFKASEVASLLDKLHDVPHLWFQSHATWKPCVSAWDVYHDIPESRSGRGHRGAITAFHCVLVLRHETLSVEGLHELLPVIKMQNNMRDCVPGISYISISEVPVFILTQVAGKIIGWLHEEAMLLGSRVDRSFLSLNFDSVNSGRIALVAAPSFQCINWWLRVYASGKEEMAMKEKDKEKSEAPFGFCDERFLGIVPLETLRALVMDLLKFTAGSE